MNEENEVAVEVEQETETVEVAGESAKLSDSVESEIKTDNNVGGKEIKVKQEGKAIISYNDFAKLDITIGTIVSVEVVEGADKLLKLEVDIQEEKPRQIISGIREYFEDVQFLVGKQCPFLTNLEPRTIRGVESQGMILAAENDGVFSLLIPHNELPEGTRIS